MVRDAREVASHVDSELKDVAVGEEEECFGRNRLLVARPFPDLEVEV